MSVYSNFSHLKQFLILEVRPLARRHKDDGYENVLWSLRPVGDGRREVVTLVAFLFAFFLWQCDNLIAHGKKSAETEATMQEKPLGQTKRPTFRWYFRDKLFRGGCGWVGEKVRRNDSLCVFKWWILKFNWAQ